MMVDVTELRFGDILSDEPEFGPVRSHRPNVNFPETEEMVYFQNGDRDTFGKPQRLDVIREGIEELAARLEKEQSHRDYRATWPLFNRDAESSAWEYTNSAYRAWAHETNR